MKRIPLIMAVGALLLVLSAGVALAHLNHINCANQDPENRLCKGTDGRDHIIGSDSTPGEDNIYADNNDSDNRGDADVVEGRDEDDTIRGQEGADELAGGEEDDDLYGNSGGDVIVDRVDYGPDDVDTVYGGGGDDDIDVKDGDGDDWVSCGKGRDRVWFDSGDVIKGNCERKNRGDRPEFNTSDTTATASAAGQQYGETTGEQTEAQ